MKIIKTYSELKKLKTFEERCDYLRLYSNVGVDTFGFNRYLNQTFYRSKEWLSVRNKIIVRDSGCDLGVIGHEIHEKILVHHINPITIEDISLGSDFLLNPENLITTILSTHNLIHYGYATNSLPIVTERIKNDTCPWK